MKVFDLHCDPLSELRRAEMRGDGQTFARNNGHIDLEKLEKGDYMLQCFAAFVNLADPTLSYPSSFAALTVLVTRTSTTASSHDVKSLLTDSKIILRISENILSILP